MNKTIKRKWLKALRGGDIPQAQNRLRKGDAFCCLGVLCNIVSPRRWHKPKGDDTYYYGPIIAGAHGYPPQEVLEEVGLSKRSAKSLAMMNDKGASFEKIAKVIDKRL